MSLGDAAVWPDCVRSVSGSPSIGFSYNADHYTPQACSVFGNSAQEVLITRDPEKAARIREEDDAMDDLHRHLFTVLMDKEWKHGALRRAMG